MSNQSSQDVSGTGGVNMEVDCDTLPLCRAGVAKPLPRGKKVPVKIFSSALWNLLKIKFVKEAMRILQQLIEKLMIAAPKIAFDMVWSNYSLLKVKLALVCFFTWLNYAPKLFLAHCCARPAFWAHFSARYKKSVANPGVEHWIKVRWY